MHLPPVLASGASCSVVVSFSLYFSFFPSYHHLSNFPKVRSKRFAYFFSERKSSLKEPLLPISITFSFSHFSSFPFSFLALWGSATRPRKPCKGLSFFEKERFPIFFLFVYGLFAAYLFDKHLRIAILYGYRCRYWLITGQRSALVNEEYRITDCDLPDWIIR